MIQPADGRRPFRTVPLTRTGQTMTDRYRKKLIEVALPLEAINAASVRESSIRHGHPSTLHLWWARRPLAACRAVLFAQLVDDPSGWPERFPTQRAQDAERRRLFGLIEQLVRWENSTNEHVLDAARFEIARSVAWNRGEEPPAKAHPKAVLAYLQAKAPPVYDPFSGGGSIPLEAQRLGLRAHGSDLNPVAVLIGKALVEIPPKFTDLPPVNPDRDMHLRWKGAQGLAEDVRHYGRWMRDEAERRIGHIYPHVEVTERAVREQPSLAPLKGQKRTVIAWLWARTVASPNPAANGAHVPLVSSFMLSTRDGRKAWVEPVTDANAPDGYRFAVRSGQIAKEDEDRAKAGTKTGRGSNFNCVLTHTPITPQHIKAEGAAGRMGSRLMAVVAEGDGGRCFLSPTPEHEAIAKSAEPLWAPDFETSRHPQYMGAVGYGIDNFRKLFTRRQLVALTTFSDLVSQARERALTDARAAGLPDDGTRLAGGGAGAEAYADAVATYLGCAVNRASNFWNRNATWESSGGFVRGLFTLQAIPMVWDYTESNPFSQASGNWKDTCVNWIGPVDIFLCVSV